MRNSIIHASGLVAALLALCAAGFAANVPDIAHAVDGHYNALKSFKAAFTEIYTAPGVSRTEGGTVWLKKPGRMRWEYHNPRPKLFVMDSQNAYFYVEGESQARKTSVKKLDDIRSPMRFLLGKSKLDKELEGLSLAHDVAPLQPGDVVLRGVPKGMEDRITSVLLEVSPGSQLMRIVIYGADGAITDFRFSQIEENVPVQDSLFRFSPPPGVETIHDEQVAQ
jgi:outer membrane lipoprotein carrier protein